jgi:L-ascorbate metabolism protein UlaG (beta-lactamase superfamily)
MKKLKIKHYGFNSFIIQGKQHKVAIDPGNNVFGINRYSLISKKDWKGITHILITHGDPDHFHYALPMAKKTGANIICGKELEKDFFSQKIKNVFSLNPGEVFEKNDLKAEGIKTIHGPLDIKFANGLIEIHFKFCNKSSGDKKIFIGSSKYH